MKSTKCKCITTKYGKAKVCSCGLKCWCVHMCPFSPHGMCVCWVGGENKSSMTMAVVARVTHSQGSNWSKRSQIHDPAKIHNLQVSICNCNILQKQIIFPHMYGTKMPQSNVRGANLLPCPPHCCCCPPTPSPPPPDPTAQKRRRRSLLGTQGSEHLALRGARKSLL